MDGGKVLGEGSFGCVFKPGLRCVDKAEHVGNSSGRRGKRGMVSKVFDSQEDLDTEWDFSKVIAKIDPEQKYFIYGATRCNTSPKQISRDPQHNECSLINGYESKQKFPQIIMKDGGMTFAKYLPDMYEKGTPLTRRDVIRIILPALKGLVLFAKAGYVHQDIKTINVVVDPKTQELRIIDYSLMKKIKEIYDPEANHKLYSDYWVNPAEYRVFTALEEVQKGLDPVKFDPTWKNRFIRKIVDREAETLRFIHSSSNDRYDLYSKFKMFWRAGEQEETLLKLVNKMIAKPLDKRRTFMTRVAARSDVYSVGLLIVDVYEWIMSEKKDNYDDVVAFHEIVRGLIHPDPFLRLTAAKAVKKAEAFLKTVPSKRVPGSSERPVPMSASMGSPGRRSGLGGAGLRPRASL